MNKTRVVYYASPLDRLTTTGNINHPNQGDVMTRQHYDWQYKMWHDVISATYGTLEGDKLLTDVADLYDQYRDLRFIQTPIQYGANYT